MTCGLCVALLLAQAEPQLEPSAEFEQRVVELEKLRTRAFGLQLAASAGYAVAFGCIAWVLAEVIALEVSKSAGPLSGRRYTTVAPPLALVIGAVLVGGTSIALHVTSRSLSRDADEEQQLLDRLQ